MSDFKWKCWKIKIYGELGLELQGGCRIVMKLWTFLKRYVRTLMEMTPEHGFNLFLGTHKILKITTETLNV